MTHLLVAQETHKRSMKIMGCSFDITVIAKDKHLANHYIDLAVLEMTRIEKLISSWDQASQTSEINRNAGIRPVKVDLELFNLINRAIQISHITDGAFDISYAAVDKIWTFDGKSHPLPDPDLVKHSIKDVGYTSIILNKGDTTVYLPTEGMKIAFGAIGKGYSADKAKQLLIQEGVSGGIINASGDMNTWGKQTNGMDWQIAITNPLDKSKSYGLLPLKQGAVVTSGSYEKYTLINGKRYAHIIDPRTGYPAEGILSVTIFAPSAELADALATSIFVMGVPAGLDRINQLANIDCVIIDNDGILHHSKNIKINTL